MCVYIHIKVILRSGVLFFFFNSLKIYLFMHVSVLW